MKGSFAAFALCFSGLFASTAYSQTDDAVWLQFGQEIVGSQESATLLNETVGSGDAASDLIWKLVDQGFVGSFHYQTSFAEMNPELVKLVGKANLPPLRASELSGLQTAWNARPNGFEPVFSVIAALDGFVQERGARLLVIETSTDFESFALVNERVFCRWNRVRLSNYVSTSQATYSGQDVNFWNTETWSAQPQPCS